MRKLIIILVLTVIGNSLVSTMRQPIKESTPPELPQVRKVMVKGFKKPSQKPPKAILATFKAKPVSKPKPVQSVPSLSGGSAKAFIYQHESGNNPGSINSSSGACGLGQALPCSKMPCSLSDYACQDRYFTSYMLGRYGSWSNAQSFWQANGWW